LRRYILGAEVEGLERELANFCGAGARPYLPDIDPRTFNLDPGQVESFLRGSKHDKLRVLLPVHLYGQCADMDRLQHLADGFHLSVIEDVAQAIGATWRNESGKVRGARRRRISHHE
jgi:dTDP-4-amino-4,6-dideoxygalactose transaminase